MSSQQQTQIYDEQVHRFENLPFEKHVPDPVLDKELLDFQQERLARVSLDGARGAVE